MALSSTEPKMMSHMAVVKRKIFILINSDLI